MPGIIALLAICFASAAASSLSRPLSARLLKLRGGEDDDPILGRLKKQGNIGPLSREEIAEKLNTIPLFCIMQPDGSVISLPDPAGNKGDECCTFFSDAAEASSTLKKVIAANPGLSGLKLACHGLGDYIKMSDSWPRKAADASVATVGAPRLKLQGPREVTTAVGPQMVDALKVQGLDPGTWQLAVFIAEELSQSTPEGEQILLPIFLNPNDVRAAFDKLGVPAKALEGVKVMELRMLLQSMSEPTPDAVNPWRAVRFIASPDAVALAQDIEASAAK